MSDVKDAEGKMNRSTRYKRSKRKRQRELIGKFAVVLCIAGVGVAVGTHFPKAKEHDSKVYETQVSTEEAAAQAVEEETPEVLKFIYPSRSESYTEITDEEVLSPYIALLDVENHQVIAGRNADARIYPASMTKVMTLIVAAEHLTDETQTFTMTAEIVDRLYRDEASRAGYEPGDTVTVKDLMYGLILPSGADAAVALSLMTAGSEEAFAELMNEKCQELGLTQTHFMNASGLHDENQYTTPVEMAMILEYAMENPVCKEVLSTYQYQTAPLASNPEGILLTSTMFSRMYGTEVENVVIQAGKTGYTQEAGNCLVSYAVKNEHAYIALTAGAANRWNVVYDDFKLYGNYLP